MPINGDEDLQSRPSGSLLVEIVPFLVKTSRDILLLDTGLGFSKNGRLQILENLASHGIQSGDVTKVLLSHLHKDHAGGISYRDRIGHYQLTFPQATYYVQQKELAFALETGFPSYMTEEIGILENNSQVILLDGDGVIDGYIHYAVTASHSPYHQVYRVEEGGEIIFFGADDAPQLQQMKSRFVAKYDYDGKKCMELRREWWEEGTAAGWTFLFYHDVKQPVYKASQ